MIDYYIRVAPFLLLHLTNRPLTLIRFPDGISSKSFYQKDWKGALPTWVKHTSIPRSSGREEREMIVCNNASTLVWLVNLANIELHSWHSRIDGDPHRLNHPDFIVFDIDPAKDDLLTRAISRERFEQAVEAAFLLKKLLEEEGLTCYLKTTGKNGLHLYLPIVRKFTYSQTRRFAKTVAERLEANHPRQFTTTWEKQKRGGKVLVDFNQNAPGKTLVSLYSLRATPEATVSTPLSWEELLRTSPTDFTIETVPDRLEKQGDLWKEILGSAQDLTRILNSE